MSCSKLISAREPYFAPCCEILSLQAEGVLCQSPFGEAGKAGSDGAFVNELESEDYRDNMSYMLEGI